MKFFCERCLEINNKIMVKRKKIKKKLPTSAIELLQHCNEDFAVTLCVSDAIRRINGIEFKLDSLLNGLRI